MYFFYFDESGSRDPSVGTLDNPRDHLYVLLAVGLYEREWKPFEQAISGQKLELLRTIRQNGLGELNLADCEIKSNWLRNAKERAKQSPFLNALEETQREQLVASFFSQIEARNAVVLAAVIDKRYLHDHVTHEILHKKAYEFVLERIQHFMREYHPKHQALIVMDDTSKQLNQAIALKHSYFQREGNQNLRFDQIVEYPFFTRSELSNGVQLADLLAYNVYRAFKSEDLTYPYFRMLLPAFYRRKGADTAHDGLKIWPKESPLVRLARELWQDLKTKTPGDRGLECQAG